MPLERLEAQICELAGHLTAATCRFLVLLGDFDARRGWASWEMNSCASWLSWKCQMSSGTAREHVRVARALRDLPVIRAGFGAGRLSYAKVRALTRIATPATEAGLAEIAGPMTGNQLERFARAHRQVSRADDAAARVRRRLAWRFEEDGSLAGTFCLPPAAGAVLLKALRAAAGDLEHPHEEEGVGVSAETPAAAGRWSRRPRAWPMRCWWWPRRSWPGRWLRPIIRRCTRSWCTSASVPWTPPASAAATPLPTQSGVAETPAPTPPVPGDPADQARCHVEDGPAISVSTAQMLGCAAVLSWMLHDRDGSILRLGRRRRRPGAALRRAARERDKCRCRFPGCESRRVDLHHIVFWSHGGRTDLDNLVSLCKYHHMLVHERGYLIAARPGGTFAFWRPDGTALPPSPPLPEPAGVIGDCHEAEITEDTIIPPWYGERLDLDHAIYTCLANARTPEERQAQREQGRLPPVIACRSSNQRAGPTGYASTTPSTPNASTPAPHDRPRQNSGGPAGAPDRRRRPGSTKVMSTGLIPKRAARLSLIGLCAERQHAQSGKH